MGYGQDGQLGNLFTELGVVWVAIPHTHTLLLTNRRLKTWKSWQSSPLNFTNPGYSKHCIDTSSAAHSDKPGKAALALL